MSTIENVIRADVRSGFLKLDRRDFMKGMMVAIAGAVIGVVLQWLDAPSFDFYSFQWNEVLRTAIIAALTYLSTNLVTTRDGRVLGVVQV